MKTRSQSIVLEKDTQWENPAPGIRRQVMAYDGQIMLVKVCFEKGAVGTPHEHFHSQVTYCVSGTFEMLIGDKKNIIHGGDAYYIEPDEWHGCVCLEEGMLIDVFSPMRADFLQK